MCWSLLILGTLASAAAWAQEPVETQKTDRVQRVREYSARVEWHRMAEEADIPQQVEKPSDTLPDLLPTSTPIEMGPVSPELMHYYLRQMTPRARDRDDQKKSRNWLVLDVEGRPKEAKTSREPAGESADETQKRWGWLAESVFRQQAAESKQSEDEEEMVEEEIAPSILQTEELWRQAIQMQPGLMVTVDSVAERPSVTPMKTVLDKQEQEVLNKLAVDEGGSSRSGRAMRPGEPLLTRSKTSELSALHALPIDNAQLLGRDPMRDAVAAPATVLPQTAALLSRPREGLATAPNRGAAPTRSLFEAALPKSTFDLSMPKAEMNFSALATPASSIGVDYDRSGFFTSSGGGLSTMPSPSSRGLSQRSGDADRSMTPGFSRGTMDSSRPLFPSAPSWRQ